jgi:hypothetical protein
MFPPQLRGIIHSADRYAFRKEHLCLLPGCKRKAISSHAISRTSILEALADKGVVYTGRYSFGSMMRMTTLGEPVEVIEVGVNQASVFKGYCSNHDSRLFAAADTIDGDKQGQMFIPLHLRALSLEFCRKRLVADFSEQLRKLAAPKGIALGSGHEVLAKGRDVFKEILDYFFLRAPKAKDNITFFVAVFACNIMVSCCGVFDHGTGNTTAAIGYNIVSYRDVSILALTTFESTNDHLGSFLSDYGSPGNVDFERLINDVAFSKGEEPLIFPRLWRSLTGDEQLHVRQSLRPPAVRMSATVPRVVKLSRDAVVPAPTPEIWERLLRSFSRR